MGYTHTKKNGVVSTYGYGMTCPKCSSWNAYLRKDGSINCNHPSQGCGFDSRDITSLDLSVETNRRKIVLQFHPEYMRYDETPEYIQREIQRKLDHVLLRDADMDVIELFTIRSHQTIDYILYPTEKFIKIDDDIKDSHLLLDRE
jgi:hypothetical protein